MAIYKYLGSGFVIYLTVQLGKAMKKLAYNETSQRSKYTILSIDA